MARLVFAVVLAPPSLALMDGVRMFDENIGGAGTNHGWVRGWPTLGVGIALAVGSRRLARWIVRVPDDGCPRCGHADGEHRARAEAGLTALWP